MTIKLASLKPFVIPNGGTASQAIDWQTLSDAEALTVAAPAALDAVTYTWQVSMDNGSTWKTLVDLTATAVPVPAAAKAITYNGIFAAYTQIRIAASGAAAADRSFAIMKAFTVR